MELMTILMWFKNHYKIVLKAVFALAIAFLCFWCINLHKENKKLSESLELAQNNVEAYQGLFTNSQQALNVLKLDMEDLQHSNDSILRKMDSVMRENKIKPKQVATAATQTQVINVIASKEVGGEILVKDTTYSDSIKYNDLTTVYYTIGKDTVSVGLDVKNEQYLFVYHTREYKNKKSFIKRLFTWDFKKVDRYKYDIVNTNDLLKTSDVRVIEAK